MIGRATVEVGEIAVPAGVVTETGTGMETQVGRAAVEVGEEVVVVEVTVTRTTVETIRPKILPIILQASRQIRPPNSRKNRQPLLLLPLSWSQPRPRLRQ